MAEAGTLHDAFIDELRDAYDAEKQLIAGGQRAEHYEMAAYGSLIAWARTMGHTEAAGLLELNLAEERAADKKLSALAEGGINQDAASQAHRSDQDESEGKPKAPKKKAARPASRR
jgi:ferritin-like metal-binding protein YciE